MNVNDLKKKVIENRPIAMLNDNGEIELEFSDKFYEIIDIYCDEKKAEVKRTGFKIAILSSLGFTISGVVATIDPNLLQPVITIAKTFLVGGGVYYSSIIREAYMAQRYHDDLPQAFIDEAKSRFESGQYYDIDDNGIISFDKPKGVKK